jgi:hypothetical protein
MDAHQHLGLNLCAMGTSTMRSGRPPAGLTPTALEEILGAALRMFGVCRRYEPGGIAAVLRGGVPTVYPASGSGFTTLLVEWLPSPNTVFAHWVKELMAGVAASGERAPPMPSHTPGRGR